MNDVVLSGELLMAAAAIYLVAGFLTVLLSLFSIVTFRNLAIEFPPISDKEFLARCTPGTDPKIALRVREIMSDASGVPVEMIHPEMSIIEDLC